MHLCECIYKYIVSVVVRVQTADLYKPLLANGGFCQVVSLEKCFRDVYMLFFCCGLWIENHLYSSMQ